jgi:hypothetical protein
MQGRHNASGGYRSDAKDSPLDGVLHGGLLEDEIMQSESYYRQYNDPIDIEIVCGDRLEAD